MAKLAFHHTPMVIGLLVLLITLPVVTLNLHQQQLLQQQAQSRSFSLPSNAQVAPGQIVVKYRDSVELKTESSINQHTEGFEVGQITSSFSNTSVNNLEAVGTRKIERVFKNEKLPQEKSAVQNMLGLIGQGAKPSHLANFVVIQIPSTSNIETAINLLLKDPNVESAEPNYQTTIFANANDAFYNQQWDLPKISMPQAWDMTNGTNAVTVGVIDSGADLSHPDLQTNLVTGGNIIDGTQTVQDDNGHGTHVSGTIDAVTNNSQGVAGVAGFNGQVHIMPIKTMDRAGLGTDTLSAAGIPYAANHGVKVVNMSNGQLEDTTILKAAIDDAVSRGVTIVAAAGNCGVLTSANAAICQNMVNPLTYPAAYPNVISVENTDQSDHLSVDSEFGNYITLAAPREGIISTFPRTPVGITCPNSVAQGYCTIGGTSMAAPHVAGVVALMLAINPSLTPASIQQILHSSADDTGTKDTANNEVFRLNAQKALAAAGTASSASPTGSAGATATPSPSPTTVLTNLVSSVTAACGGKGIAVKNAGTATNRNWQSFVDSYGGTTFIPTGGDVYVYAQQACSITIPSGSVTLTAGWNKITM